MNVAEVLEAPLLTVQDTDLRFRWAGTIGRNEYPVTELRDPREGIVRLQTDVACSG